MCLFIYLFHCVPSTRRFTLFNPNQRRAHSYEKNKSKLIMTGVNYQTIPPTVNAFHIVSSSSNIGGDNCCTHDVSMNFSFHYRMCVCLPMRSAGVMRHRADHDVPVASRALRPPRRYYWCQVSPHLHLRGHRS